MHAHPGSGSSTEGWDEDPGNGFSSSLGLRMGALGSSVEARAPFTLHPSWPPHPADGTFCVQSTCSPPASCRNGFDEGQVLFNILPSPCPPAQPHTCGSGPGTQQAPAIPFAGYTQLHQPWRKAPNREPRALRPTWSDSKPRLGSLALSSGLGADSRVTFASCVSKASRSLVSVSLSEKPILPESPEQP